MKRVFGTFEVVFDIAYLLAATSLGIALLFFMDATAVHYISGSMAMVLVCGDASHLVPRIKTILTQEEETMRRALGRGKQIASVTMTVFYLLLWELGQLVFPEKATFLWTAAVYLLAAVRIIFCFLPQNRWTDRYPPVKWGVLRNIPFFLLGILVAVRFFLCRFSAEPLEWLWLAVILSFLFYLPVVLLANRNPKIGMLMLPKTCMYLWMLVICINL